MIETRRLKNVVIFVQTILSFVLSRKTYYSNLNEKKITDNKTFRKTIKPFLSDKTPSDETITLIENHVEKHNDIKTGNTKTVNVLNAYHFYHH